MYISNNYDKQIIIDELDKFYDTISISKLMEILQISQTNIN